MLDQDTTGGSICGYPPIGKNRPLLALAGLATRTNRGSLSGWGSSLELV
jgi:hypothetical protein